MDDDDEFGDLYADVLRPVPLHLPPPIPYFSTAAAPNPTLDPLLDEDDDDDLILYGAPRSAPSEPSSLNPLPTVDASPVNGDNGEEDWLLGQAPDAVEAPEIWDDDDDAILARPSSALALDLAAPGEPRVLEEEDCGALDGAPAFDAEGFGVPGVSFDAFPGGGAERIEMGDPFEEPEIPGLSTRQPSPGSQAMKFGDVRASGSNNWDSDSEDDLQIVLNNDNPVLPVGGGMGSDDDEDGEEDFVIVADRPIHQQPMEEQDWGEETIQPAAEGERKEVSDAGKASSSAVTATGLMVGYNNRGFHPQHHSMYKYVRPGAGSVPGGHMVGSVGGPGQIRPLSTLGPIAGRGRGDWRPAGGRGVLNAQRNINSSYGLPNWSNNSSGRTFGNGLDFILPSHKTAFDIDIESFEEKPWRHLGVDISDYFNFGLDEDNWKDYCKQLEQFRLEATMQSKIRVYESGRSEQEYDPELPPELAAAAGHHNSSADNPHNIKVENGQDDLSGQGRGTGCIKAPIPIGRAIQVECGYAERFPSIDTRAPRIRDPDAIIEIVLQDDGSTMSNGTLDQPEQELERGDSKGAGDFEEDGRKTESEYIDHFPHASNGRKRGILTKEVPFASEDGGVFGTHRGGRLSQGTSRGRHSNMSEALSVNAISVRSLQMDRRDTDPMEKPGGSMEDKQISEASPARAVSPLRELSMEERESEPDDRVALGDSFEVEGDDTASDFRISGETLGDDTLPYSAKKQKLSSRVEKPAMQDNGDDDDLRKAHSDNSKGKSGNSKDYQRRREGGEEVIQDGRKRIGDLRKRHEEEERSFRRNDDYGRDGRHGLDRNRIASKGRETTYHLYPHRDWDANSAHHVRGRSEGFERPKEMDARQRREDDVHSRRVKGEDTRRERTGETVSRNRSKVKVGDRNDKDDDIHLKKRVDGGDWRSRHREGGPRQKEREDPLMKRRENMDDAHTKRKKDEEHSRREKIDKGDALHVYRPREDSSRKKRERDDGADHRRDNDVRMREKTEDRHSAKHKDDSWRHREREDRQRLKQPHEDSLARHEREEVRAVVRNGRATEDKTVARNGKNMDGTKGVISDKDNMQKDRRRHNEPFKRADRTGEGNDSQHRREDEHPREKQSTSERSSRHEKLSSHSDRPSTASDSLQMHRGKERESTRKSKDTEISTQILQGPGKRKHEEDHDTHRNEKVVLKGNNEKESNSPKARSKVGDLNLSGEREVTQLHHTSAELGEDPGSEDENQRGRSKLERWTSQKERDYSTIDEIQPLPSRAKEIEESIAELFQADECVKGDGNNANDSDMKGINAGQIVDRMGDDRDRHLDTVAKLKMRSERFKLPMPGEKETVVNKKVENEVPLTLTEAAIDADIKPERPVRKRRWTGS